MKSTKSNGEEGKPNYPFLGESIEHGGIVMFDKEACGIVVHTAKGFTFNLGDYRTDWFMCSFKPFNGRVVLNLSLIHI